mmetsp:Transcript_51942/g.119484  ORF Transcript_51942/g.119484 Transcript_51942/m.119484 type:complete len:389 (+) Transcript_51942:58-1224(+)
MSARTFDNLSPAGGWRRLVQYSVGRSGSMWNVPNANIRLDLRMVEYDFLSPCSCTPVVGRNERPMSLHMHVGCKSSRPLAARREHTQLRVECCGEHEQRRRLDRGGGDVADEGDAARLVELVEGDALRPSLPVDLDGPREAAGALSLGDAPRHEFDAGDVKRLHEARHGGEAEEGRLVIEVLVADVLGKEAERFGRFGAARVRLLPQVLHKVARAFRHAWRVHGRLLIGLEALRHRFQQPLGQLARLEEGLAALAHIGDLSLLVELEEGGSSQPVPRHAGRLAVPREPARARAVRDAVDHEARATRPLGFEQRADRIAPHCWFPFRHVVPHDIRRTCRGDAHRHERGFSEERPDERGAAAEGGRERRHPAQGQKRKCREHRWELAQRR